jgi:excisionase family DNA binding protein
MEDDAMLTTKQAAEELGVSERRVRQIVGTDLLPATRVGRDWVIRRGDLAKARVRTTKRGPVPGKQRGRQTDETPRPR